MAGNPLAQALMGAAGGGPEGPLPGGAPEGQDDAQDQAGDLAGALREVNAILEAALAGHADIDMQSAGPELEKTMQLMDELTQQGPGGPGGPPSPGAPPSGPPMGGL